MKIKDGREAEKQMTDKELRHLRRSELLELLLEQTRRCAALELRIEELEGQLEERKIRIKESGSIAEAALKLNHVFEAAEAACRQYVENMTADAKGEEDEKERMGISDSGAAGEGAAKRTV